jgi:hypothetical protein
MSRALGQGITIERPATDFFDPARLDGIKGASLLLLGQAGSARGVFETALRQRDPSNIKGRSLIKLEIAASLIHEDEPDEAVTVISDALAIPAETRVGPIMWRADGLIRRLGRWRSRPAVRELDEHLRAMASQ